RERRTERRVACRQIRLQYAIGASPTLLAQPDAVERVQAQDGRVGADLSAAVAQLEARGAGQADGADWRAAGVDHRQARFGGAQGDDLDVEGEIQVVGGGDVLLQAGAAGIGDAGGVDALEGASAVERDRTGDGVGAAARVGQAAALEGDV